MILDYRIRITIKRKEWLEEENVYNKLFKNELSDPLFSSKECIKIALDDVREDGIKPYAIYISPNSSKQSKYVNNYWPDHKERWNDRHNIPEGSDDYTERNIEDAEQAAGREVPVQDRDKDRRRDPGKVQKKVFRNGRRTR